MLIRGFNSYEEAQAFIMKHHLNPDIYEIRRMTNRRLINNEY